MSKLLRNTNITIKWQLLIYILYISTPSEEANVPPSEIVNVKNQKTVEILQFSKIFYPGVTFK